jgi:hypothetical protein
MCVIAAIPTGGRRGRWLEAQQSTRAREFRDGAIDKVIRKRRKGVDSSHDRHH